MILQKVGYFDGLNRQLIAPCLSLTEPNYPRDKVLSYMSSGVQLFAWLEHVPCMYGCSIEEIGSAEYSDGTWVWTKEFIHYIDYHNIAIPAPFIAHMENAFYTFVETKTTEKIKNWAKDISNLEAEIKYSNDLWDRWIKSRCPDANLPNAESRHSTPSAAVPKKSIFDLPEDW